MSGLEVQAPAVDIASLTIDEWFRLDPEVDVVLVRKSDGLRITLCPNAQCYLAHVERDEVVLSCVEIEEVLKAAKKFGSDALSLVARAIDAKKAFAGLRITEDWMRTLGGAR